MGDEMIRVRILVAVTSKGEWNARGSEIAEPIGLAVNVSRCVPNEGRSVAMHWVEADVPLPQAPQSIQGTVSDAD